MRAYARSAGNESAERTPVILLFHFQTPPFHFVNIFTQLHSLSGDRFPPHTDSRTSRSIWMCNSLLPHGHALHHWVHWTWSRGAVASALNIRGRVAAALTSLRKHVSSTTTLWAATIRSRAHRAGRASTVRARGHGALLAVRRAHLTGLAAVR